MSLSASAVDYTVLCGGVATIVLVESGSVQGSFFLEVQEVHDSVFRDKLEVQEVQCLVLMDEP